MWFLVAISNCLLTDKRNVRRVRQFVADDDLINSRSKQNRHGCRRTTSRITIV